MTIMECNNELVGPRSSPYRLCGWNDAAGIGRNWNTSTGAIMKKISPMLHNSLNKARSHVDFVARPEGRGYLEKVV
jgi:hypothetical protein